MLQRCVALKIVVANRLVQHHLKLPTIREMRDAAITLGITGLKSPFGKSPHI